MQPYDEHGWHVEEEVRQCDEEGEESGLLVLAVVHDSHPVACVHAALLAAQVQQDADVSQHHRGQRKDVESRIEPQSFP